MDVVVFGAGSLGTLLGGLLARAHDVTLVGREPHIGAVCDSGLRVTGAVEARTRPAAVTDLGAGASFDLAVVAVKAHDTPAAADALADADLDACLSVQNGLGNEDRLGASLDCPVLAGTCSYGARLDGPGVVDCTGVGEVVLGPHEGAQSAPSEGASGGAASRESAQSEPSEGASVEAASREGALAERVGRAFDAAGVETTVADDMPRRLWEKLAVNAGVNAVAHLADMDNGAVLAGPAEPVAREATREAARVAREAGVDLPEEAAIAALERVVGATADNTASMRQDRHRAARTEIDAINGAVVERAASAVPTNATLTRLVRAWEAERGLRE